MKEFEGKAKTLSELTLSGAFQVSPELFKDKEVQILSLLNDKWVPLEDAEKIANDWKNLAFKQIRKNTNIETTLKLLNVFRLSANPKVFEKIFGDEKIHGRKIWELHYDKFLSFNSDVVAFWNYLDEAYKEIFQKYLVSGLGEKTE